jgi:hypothetical protein
VLFGWQRHAENTTGHAALHGQHLPPLSFFPHVFLGMSKSKTIKTYKKNSW